MFILEYHQGVHQGGTKEYHLYLLSSVQTKSSILVKRWGKVGSDGQGKVEVMSGNDNSVLDKMLKERASKGYAMNLVNALSQKYNSVDLALKTIPAAIRRGITNAQLALIDPVNFSSSDRSPYDPLHAERSVKAQEQIIEAAQKEQASVDAVLKSNPMYGMF